MNARTDGPEADPRSVRPAGGAEDDEFAEGPGGGADSAEAVECREREVGPDGHGQRLDKVLVAMAPEFSRSHLQGLIDAGHVRVGAQVQRTASRKLQAGQRVAVDLVPTAESTAFRPEALPLTVLWEDEHLAVIDKPAGLVVHPAPGHWSGTLLNGLLGRWPDAARLARAGIVHRLDKDTSGLIIVARSAVAQTALVRMIAAREVSRRYLAIAQGRPAEDDFSVEAPLGRDPVSRVKVAVVASGRPARTDVRVLGTATVDGAAHAATCCTLHTGRTHQIRVHLASRGLPLVGDTLYGGRAALGLSRQALHAAWLAFDHPVHGQRLSFHAPLPADLAAAWAALGLAAPGDAPPSV
jgi:23S rRNA pseudouridine1911/1915/1917 synthase